MGRGRGKNWTATVAVDTRVPIFRVPKMDPEFDTAVLTMRLCLDCGQPAPATRCATCFFRAGARAARLRGRDWPLIRAEVLARYAHMCGKCGALCPPPPPPCDHRVPLVKVVRRRFEPQNLWPLCEGCDKRFGGRV